MFFSSCLSSTESCFSYHILKCFSIVELHRKIVFKVFQVFFPIFKSCVCFVILPRMFQKFTFSSFFKNIEEYVYDRLFRVIFFIIVTKNIFPCLQQQTSAIISLEILHSVGPFTYLVSWTQYRLLNNKIFEDIWFLFAYEKWNENRHKSKSPCSI